MIGPKTWDRIDKIFGRKMKQPVAAPRLIWVHNDGFVCHAPDLGPTRLANQNWFRGAKPYTGTPYFYLFIFFRADLISVVYK